MGTIGIPLDSSDGWVSAPPVIPGGALPQRIGSPPDISFNLRMFPKTLPPHVL